MFYLFVYQGNRQSRLYENVLVEKRRAALYDTDLVAFHSMVKSLRGNHYKSKEYFNFDWANLMLYFVVMFNNLGHINFIYIFLKLIIIKSHIIQNRCKCIVNVLIQYRKSQYYLFAQFLLIFVKFHCSDCVLL